MLQSQKDADFFCGREDEIVKLRNSLQVYRLTILHGAAGVGKTSFLNAGVAHRLHRDAELNRKRWGFPGCGVAVFPQMENAQAWITKPLTNLTTSIREQMEENFGVRVSPFDPDRGLKEFLGDVAERLGDTAEGPDEPGRIGRLYVIFDQFEAYLQHEENCLQKDNFCDSFVAICRYIDTPVHFLIALESSAFCKLDRFEGLIPRLLDNRYELGHLDVKAAEQAITEPIHKFNVKRKALNQPEVSFDNSLVHEILEEFVAIEEERKGSLAGGKIAFDLRLMFSLNDVSGIPTEGKNLIIVAKVNNVLQFRIFGGDGKVVVDTDDKKLPEQRQQIEDLKKQLERLWPRHELSRGDKGPVTLAVKSIVGLAPKIEAPYLQLVMQRLWQEEGIPERSLILHADTFQSLGGTEGIIKRHVDQCMSKLSQSKRDMAARILHQLLIPSRPARIDELVLHANDSAKDWQPKLQGKEVEQLITGHLAPLRIVRPSANGEYEIFLHTLRRPLDEWVRRQQQLDELLKKIEKAEETFAHSQLDGLRQAADAALFAIKSIEEGQVSDSEVPTPPLIGSLKRMLNEVMESRRITDPDSLLNSMSYSPDGKWFAVASLDGRVHLLNRENGRESTIQDRGEKSGSVLYVTLGPDERVALASGHGYARILDFDGKVLNQFPKEPGADPCHSAAFSADGKRLATGSMEGVARIWDIDRDRCIAEWRTHELPIHLVAFSPTQPFLLTSSWDGTVRLWGDTGKPICVYQVEGQAIYWGSFSRCGDRVATVCWMSGLAHIWNFGDKEYWHEFQTHQTLVSHICFHDPEGQRVATVSWDGTVCVWDVAEKSEVEKKIYHFVTGPLSRACFSPDGHQLATNQWDGVVHLWTLVKSPRTKGQEDTTTVLQTPGIYQMCATFSPDGDQIAMAGFDKKIRLRSIRSDPLDESRVKPDLLLETLHGAPLCWVAFDPSRTDRLATASFDRTGRLWLLNGNRLDAGPCLEGHKARIFEIAYNPRGEVVATASADGTVRFWDRDGKEMARFPRGDVTPLSVYSAKFHPIENVVASAWGDGFIRLIDFFGNKVGEYHAPSPAFCVDFSRDGDFLAQCSGTEESACGDVQANWRSGLRANYGARRSRLMKGLRSGSPSAPAHPAPSRGSPLHRGTAWFGCGVSMDGSWRNSNNMKALCGALIFIRTRPICGC